MKKHRPTRQTAAPQPSYLCELEVVEGLETLAAQELSHRFGARIQWVPNAEAAIRSGAVRFRYQGPLHQLTRLSVVQSVYLIQRFDVPRPKALLGNEHLRHLLNAISTARGDQGGYRTLHLSAAGADSSIMMRIKETLAQNTGLNVDPDEGDLWLRLRPAPDGLGWEALVRLTSRPLATRVWRVCNFEGALNATVAHAMAVLTEPQPDDVVVNIGCGSGSLLIERVAAGRAGQLIGVDIAAGPLACARENIAAARLERQIELYRADVRALPLPTAAATVILADLPFGQLVGTHAGNARLYPLLLREAARVAKPGARCALITHEIRLMEEVLAKSPDWTTGLVQRVTLRGLHPRIYVLRRH